MRHRIAGLGTAGRTAVLATILVAAAAGAVYGGLSWRLAQGPIPLSFLNERIVAAIESAAPGQLRVELAETVFERDPATGDMQLSILDVVARDAEGEAVATAPRAAVRLSGRALLTGRIVPRAVSLVGPEVTLVETPRGLRLPGADAAMPLLSSAPGQALVGAFGLLADDAGLSEAGLRDARVTVIGSDGEARHLDAITVSAKGDAAGVVFRGRIGSAPGAPEITGSLRRAGSGDYVVEIAARDVSPADLGPVAPRGLADIFTSPVSSDLAFRLDRRGALEAVSGHIYVGAGHIGGGRLNLLVDEADLAFSWGRGTGRIVIEPSTLLAGYNRATVSGEIGLPERGEFDYGTVPIQLEFSDVSFGDPAGGRGAHYPSITLEALYVAQHGLMHVSRLDVAAAEGAMSFVGMIGGSGGASPGIRLAGTMLPVPFEVLADLWPPFLGSKTREWVIDHLQAGEISDARLTVDIPPGALAAALRGVPLPESAYLLEFGLDDVVFSYLGELPPISGARGQAQLTPGGFDLHMEPGSQVRLASGEAVSVGAGRFHVADRHARPANGRITLDLSGSVPAVLRLLDHAPLNIASRRGFDPDDFSGDAELAIDLDIPLLPHVHFPDISLSIDGRIDNLAAQNFHGARTVSDGDVRISVIEGRVLIMGEGLIDDLPAEIAIDEPLDGSGEGRAQSLTMRLDEAARQRLGIGLGDILRGPVIVTVSDVTATTSATTQRVEADLTQARISLPHLGIDKPAGERAQASFLMAQDAESVRLAELNLESDAIRVSGEAQFTKSGELSRLDLPVVRTVNGTDVSVKAAPEENGLSFVLRGESIDLRPSLRSLTARGSAPDHAMREDGARPAVIDIAVDSILGFNNQRLSQVEARAVQTGDQLSRFELTGRTAAGAPAVLRYFDDGNNSELAADTADGGGLLAWTGLYSNMRGGRLQLTAGRRGSDGPLVGRLVINGFAVADDPSLARLITSGEREARQQFDAASPADQRRSVNPSNVGFDTLAVPFRRTDSALHITDGVLRGPAVGATLEGSIDFANERMALNGTYVPLYEINNLFGQLPLFGPLLGGRRNEGLLGITYSISGSLQQPVLTLNPLSFVTPGVFRYILGMDNPRAYTGPRTGSVRRDPSRP